MKPEEFTFKRYSMPELAELYSCAPRTFRRYIEKIRPTLGQRVGHFYSVEQVKKIVEYLGTPFVLLVGLFVNTSEAFATRRSYHLSSDLPRSSFNDQHATYDPIVVPLCFYWIVKSFVETTWVVINIESIVRSLRCNPGRIKSKQSIMGDRLRISMMILNAVIVTGTVVVAGYIVGEVIF